MSADELDAAEGADARASEPIAVRLVVTMLAVVVGATALVVGLLLRADRPSAADLPPDAVQAGGIAVHSAYLREPVGDTAAAYFIITNVGDETDTLTSVSSPVAGMSMMHDVGKVPPTAASGPADIQMESMTPTPTVTLEPGDVVTLQPGGGHMMLEQLSGTIAPGSTVNLSLVFEKAGTITVKADVIALTDPAPW